MKIVLFVYFLSFFLSSLFLSPLSLSLSLSLSVSLSLCLSFSPFPLLFFYSFTILFFITFFLSSLSLSVFCFYYVLSIFSLSHNFWQQSKTSKKNRFLQTFVTSKGHGNLHYKFISYWFTKKKKLKKIDFCKLLWHIHCACVYTCFNFEKKLTCRFLLFVVYNVI